MIIVDLYGEITAIFTWLDALVYDNNLKIQIQNTLNYNKLQNT